MCNLSDLKKVAARVNNYGGFDIDIDPTPRRNALYPWEPEGQGRPDVEDVGDDECWCDEESEAAAREALDHDPELLRRNGHIRSQCDELDKQFRHLTPEGENRIAWPDYFLGLADVVSRRSIDAETKHGCLIIDQHKHIIGVGYNSHGRDLPSSLPRYRPDKYPWMIHSEENAIVNCTVSPWMIPGELTAYITGHPCFRCAYLLRQAHINKVVFSGTKRWLAPPVGEQHLFDSLLKQGDFTITRVKPNLNWLYNIEHINELREMGYIN